MNKTISYFFRGMNEDAFYPIFLVFPAVFLTLGFIISAIATSTVGWHLWSISVMFTITYYILAFTTGGCIHLACSYLGDESRSAEKDRYYCVIGYVNTIGLALTTISFVITMFAIHWGLGLFAILVTGIPLVTTVITITIKNKGE